MATPRVERRSDRPLLAVRGLTKRFGGFAAVSGLSFEIEQGEILGLIGPNGSGKSTTFSLIAGLHKPTSGEVLFDGQRISRLPPHAICKRGIGRTFQIPRPFRKMSILDNARLAAYYGGATRVTRDEATRLAGEALDLVGLPTDAHASVDRLGAAGLKRLEMARALATRPRLLLADESLGGLDEDEMDQAAAMLRRIRDERGITILWVEHIMGVLMKVIDRCLVLDHGELIAQGSPAQIAHDPRVIEVYLGSDASEVQDAARVATVRP